MARGNPKRKASSAIAGQGKDDKGKIAELQAYREKLEAAAAKKKDALDKKILEARRAGDLKFEEKLFKQRQKLQEQLAREKEKLNADEAKAQLQQAKEDEKELSALRKEYNKKEAEEAGQNFKKHLGNVGAAAIKGVNALGGSVEKYLDTYVKYMSQIETRIQGAGRGFNYSSISDLVRRNTAANPYIRYDKVMDNLSRLVEDGISDNLVQRAFLATISDKIATTFDAANASLLRIVRIQQQDSTASRLGMEAELTKLFNYYFSDTSYLSDSFDGVQDALLELSSQLSTEASVELEYMVQKWLGSLGSVGVSSSTLQSLAQGIGYLGTGDIEALSSNASLQNLLVMAANRANLSYSNLLTTGISSSEANTLLKSVIEYVKEIASTSNNVVKKQYAELFGVTVADMNAFQNISTTTINSLYKSAMTYTDTLTELDNQLSKVGERMHLSEKIDNVLENIMMATGIGVANNTVAYATYKAFDMLQGITGGIELPFISAFGSGMDLNMSLEGLAKGAIIGISAAQSLLGGINNLFAGTEALNPSRWSLGLAKGGFNTYQNIDGLMTSKSSTTYVSSGSELGIQQSLSDAQREIGESVEGKEQSGFNAENDFYRPTIEILSWLQTYFKEGGDTAAPLKVRIEESAVALGLNYDTSLSYPIIGKE